MGMRIQSFPESAPAITLKPGSAQPAFAARTMSRSADSVHFGAAAPPSYSQYQAEMKVALKADLPAYIGDATEDKDLWSLAGVVSEFRTALADARQNWKGQGLAPGAMYIGIVYPVPELANHLKDTVDRLNAMLHPEGLKQKMMSQTFFSTVGYNGELPELKAACDQGNQGKIIVKIDLSGMSDESLDGIEKGLDHKQIFKVLKTLGIGNPPKDAIKKAEQVTGLK